MVNKPLFIQGDTQVRLDSGALHVDMHTISPSLLSDVYIFEPASITQPALLTLCEANVKVTWFDRYGRFQGQTRGSLDGSSDRLVAQVLAAHNLTRSLELAKAFVRGRIRSILIFANRATRSGKSEMSNMRLLGSLHACLERVEECTNLASLLALEAHAANDYWSLYGALLVGSASPWMGRTRRPPRDPVNAALSFLSAIWTSRCSSAISAVGLDPRIGFLHGLRPGRDSLACDLVEEFRAFGPESEVRRMVNRAQFRGEHFETSTDGGVHLTPQGRRLVLSEFHRHSQELILHPDREQPVFVIQLLTLQAERLAKALLKGSEYEPWRVR